MPTDEEFKHEIASQIAGQSTQFFVQIHREILARFNLHDAADFMEQLEKNRVFEAKLDIAKTTSGLSKTDKKIIIKNLKAPHLVSPIGSPPGSKLDFNFNEIVKGLSQKGKYTVLNNIVNSQGSFSLIQRIDHGYQELLNAHRAKTGPLFNAITPKQIVFYNPGDIKFLLLDENQKLDYLKKSFVEQAKLGSKLTNLMKGSVILMVISTGATALSVVTSKTDNMSEAIAHEGTLLLTSIGGGWYGGLLGVTAAAAICGPGAPICALAIVVSSSAAGAAAGRLLGEVYWKVTHSLVEVIRANIHKSFTGIDYLSQGLLPSAHADDIDNELDHPQVEEDDDYSLEHPEAKTKPKERKEKSNHPRLKLDHLFLGLLSTAHANDVVARPEPSAKSLNARQRASQAAAAIKRNAEAQQVTMESLSRDLNNEVAARTGSRPVHGSFLPQPNIRNLQSPTSTSTSAAALFGTRPTPSTSSAKPKQLPAQPPAPPAISKPNVNSGFNGNGFFNGELHLTVHPGGYTMPDGSVVKFR